MRALRCAVKTMNYMQNRIFEHPVPTFVNIVKHDMADLAHLAIHVVLTLPSVLHNLHKSILE